MTMDAMTFCDEFWRMCKTYSKYKNDTPSCKGCPLYDEGLTDDDNGQGYNCELNLLDFHEKTVPLIEKWSAEHPKDNTERRPTMIDFAELKKLMDEKLVRDEFERIEKENDKSLRLAKARYTAKCLAERVGAILDTEAYAIEHGILDEHNDLYAELSSIMVAHCPEIGIHGVGKFRGCSSNDWAIITRTGDVVGIRSIHSPTIMFEPDLNLLEELIEEFDGYEAFVDARIKRLCGIKAVRA